jgi:conjugal transfer pilus assembly protein TraV
MKRQTVMFIILFLLTGCAKVFNPYESSFQCPDIDKGRCASITNAYTDSLKNIEKQPDTNTPKKEADTEPGTPEAGKSVIQSGVQSGVQAKETSAELEFNRKKFRFMQSLVEEDQPPMAAPPQTARILVLSYTGDENVMYGFRYVYFFASEPKWIFSTELNR